jgi:DNA-binding NarL/FixJ family response regulator
VIRVVLVDDQELVRTGLAMILDADPEFEVVGEAGDGEAGIAVVSAERPDVVLMDVRMPGVDGIEATRRIVEQSAEWPGDGPRVLMLTTFDLDEHVYDALRAGASGFLLKDSPAADLKATIRMTARGDMLLAPSVTRRMVEQLSLRRPSEHPAAPRLATLTDKERDVLERIARGLSNAEIGEELYISEATVKTHVGALLRKLELRDRVQAVVLAYEAGVVVPGASGEPHQG